MSSQSDKLINPTFILGGAPKCATTAIAGYLREHPRVIFSDPKEPYYWCDDFPGIRRRERMETEENYRALFEGMRPSHQGSGEGSTMYLCSDVAIEKILKHAPQTKFVFGIRKPQEIANAFHTQLISHEYETVLDFQTAWNLQETRAAGNSIPATCLDAKLLQYRRIASIGSQLQRAKRLIPSEQMLVFALDDFRDSPAAVYHRILKFLGIDDDQRTSFPKVNQASEPRSKLLIRVARHRVVRSMVRQLKQVLPPKLASRIGNISNSALKKPIERTQLDQDFRSELDAVFAEEIALTQETLGRKFNWQSPQSNADGKAGAGSKTGSAS